MPLARGGVGVRFRGGIKTQPILQETDTGDNRTRVYTTRGQKITHLFFSQPPLMMMGRTPAGLLVSLLLWTREGWWGRSVDAT